MYDKNTFVSATNSKKQTNKNPPKTPKHQNVTRDCI